MIRGCRAERLSWLVVSAVALTLIVLAALPGPG